MIHILLYKIVGYIQKTFLIIVIKDGRFDEEILVIYSHKWITGFSTNIYYLCGSICRWAVFTVYRKLRAVYVHEIPSAWELDRNQKNLFSFVKYKPANTNSSLQSVLKQFRPPPSLRDSVVSPRLRLPTCILGAFVAFTVLKLQGLVSFQSCTYLHFNNEKY